MAGETLCRLRRFHEDGILGNVDCMAAYTGQIVVLVLATRPIHAQATLVATEANLVALGNWRCILADKDDGRRHRLARGKPGGMGVAGTVAGLALMLAERSARVTLNCMGGLKNIGYRRLAVALHACGGAAYAVQRN